MRRNPTDVAESGSARHHGQVSIFDRRPGLRWAVPAGAGVLIIAGSLIGTAVASADAGLPPKTAEELLVAVQDPQASAISGTVVTSADLGLPELPTGTASTADLSSLATGSHTLRVWTDGGQRSRVALMASAKETDIVRNGNDVWMWSSTGTTAEHFVMPPRDGAKPEPPAGVTLPSTPQEAAALALSSLDPTTEVTTSGVDKVAGRPVYELILTPKQSDTLVAKVAVAIDGETNVPLRVEVYAKGMQDPAYSVGFTSVDFGTPDPSIFDFTPPPGATVTDHAATDSARPDAGAGKPEGAAPKVVGTGWSQVMVATIPPDMAAGAANADPGTGATSAAGANALALIDALPTTTGPWGSGKVLSGTLFSAILTDDGRVAIGAVNPETLGAALAAQ